MKKYLGKVPSKAACSTVPNPSQVDIRMKSFRTSSLWGVALSKTFESIIYSRKLTLTLKADTESRFNLNNPNKRKLEWGRGVVHPIVITGKNMFTSSPDACISLRN